MAEQIFSTDGNYLSINADGSINTTASISSDLTTLETYGLSTYAENVYSRIIETVGTDTYIAQAPIGSLSADAVWRVQKIDTNGSRQWADSGAFTQSCSASLSGLTFAY